MARPFRHVNYVKIEGNLGKDPVLRVSPSGKTVATVTLACTRQYEKNDELMEETYWFDVVAFEKTAEELAATYKKGDLLRLEGRLQTKSWESEDGKKGKSIEIVIDRLFPNQKQKEHATTPNETSAQQPTDEFVPQAMAQVRQLRLSRPWRRT